MPNTDPEFADHNQQIQLPRYGFSEFANLIATSQLVRHPAIARTEPSRRSRDAQGIRRGLKLATERGLMQIQIRAFPEMDTYTWTPIGFALATALTRSLITTGNPLMFKLHPFLAALPQYHITQMCLLPGPKNKISNLYTLEAIGIVRVRSRTGTAELAIDPHAFVDFFKYHPEMIPHPALLEIDPSTKPSDRRELESFHEALDTLRLDRKDGDFAKDFEDTTIEGEPDFDIAYEDEWDIL
jgi:hypothetical protein